MYGGNIGTFPTPQHRCWQQQQRLPTVMQSCTTSHLLPPTKHLPMFHPAPFPQTRSNQTTLHSAAPAAGNTRIVKSGQVILIPPGDGRRQADRQTGGHTQQWALMWSMLRGGRTVAISLQTRGTGCTINVTGHLDMYQHAHVRECTQIYVALHTCCYVSFYMTVGWSRFFFFSF